MLKLSKKVEYALMSLQFMANKSKTPHNDEFQVTARQLSRSLKIPFDSVSKTLQILASKEIVIPVHGAQGGYKLNKDLSQISFNYIIEIIDGPLALVSCFYCEREYPCPIEDSCPILDPIKQLTLFLDKQLQKISLETLLLGGKFPL